MEISYNELRSKEVVNTRSGARLGRVCDIVINSNSKCVLGLVVPGERRLFHAREDIFIPWSRICKIGQDVILVDILLEGATNVVRGRANDAGIGSEVDSDYIIE